MLTSLEQILAEIKAINEKIAENRKERAAELAEKEAECEQAITEYNKRFEGKMHPSQQPSNWRAEEGY